MSLAYVSLVPNRIKWAASLKYKVFPDEYIFSKQEYNFHARDTKSPDGEAIWVGEKRFYNRETNSALYCVLVILQMSNLLFYATQIINSFQNSMISVNHETGDDFQPIIKSSYPFLFL